MSVSVCVCTQPFLQMCEHAGFVSVYDHVEGFRPEWYNSTLYHARDTPFWSVTLDIVLMLSVHCHLASR